MKAAVFTKTESEQCGHVITARDGGGGAQEWLNLPEVRRMAPSRRAGSLR